MKVITLSIICKDSDSERILREFEQSNIAQLGIYTLETSIRDSKHWEEQEAKSMTPDDILN